MTIHTIALVLGIIGISCLAGCFPPFVAPVATPAPAAPAVVVVPAP